MLILSRKINESIIIGDDIEVTVMDIIGKSIKMGIKAPKSISVHRKEVYDAIINANIASIPRDNVISLVELLNKQIK